MYYISRYDSRKGYYVKDTEDGVEELCNYDDIVMYKNKYEIDIKGVDYEFINGKWDAVKIRPYSPNNAVGAKVAMVTGLNLVIDENKIIRRVSASDRYKDYVLDVDKYAVGFGDCCLDIFSYGQVLTFIVSDKVTEFSTRSFECNTRGGQQPVGVLNFDVHGVTRPDLLYKWYCVGQLDYPFVIKITDDSSRSDKYTALAITLYKKLVHSFKNREIDAFVADMIRENCIKSIPKTIKIHNTYFDDYSNLFDLAFAGADFDTLVERLREYCYDDGRYYEDGVFSFVRTLTRVLGIRNDFYIALYVYIASRGKDEKLRSAWLNHVRLLSKELRDNNVLH